MPNRTFLVNPIIQGGAWLYKKLLPTPLTISTEIRLQHLSNMSGKIAGKSIEEITKIDYVVFLSIKNTCNQEVLLKEILVEDLAISSFPIKIPAFQTHEMKLTEDVINKLPQLIIIDGNNKIRKIHLKEANQTKARYTIKKARVKVANHKLSKQIESESPKLPMSDRILLAAHKMGYFEEATDN